MLWLIKIMLSYRIRNIWAKSKFVEMFGDLNKNDMSWQFSPLGEICDVRDGTHESPKYVSDSKYRLLTSKNFTKGYVDFSEVNYISEEDFHEINKRSLVESGDIVMPMIGTIGSPVIVGRDANFAIKNVALIKFSGSSYSSIFIKYVFDSEYFQTIVSSNDRGSNRKFVTLDDLRTFPVPIVDRKLQDTFADYAQTCDKLKFEAQERINNLILDRNALIDKHFK